MAKYKHILITAIALIMPVIISSLLSLNVSAIENANLRWDSDSRISGTIDINGRSQGIAFTGTAPRLSATQTYTNGTTGNANPTPYRCVAELTLTMSSASSGNVTANVTTGSSDRCSDPVTGSVTVNSTDRAPTDVQWAAAGSEGDEATDESTSCSIDGVGWLVCPIVVFIGGITDGLYGALEDLFLLTEPLSTETDSPMYKVWAQIRNVANIAFILAFLVVVFSHVSSIGLSNYNIKKMLPRIIIAAILVNISYWICAIAIDASNIIGANSRTIFTDTLNVNMEEDGPWSNPSWWSAFVVVIIAGTGTVLAGLSVLLPVLISALAALVVVVAVLLLREALIILLVVISPLAFVAFLLPNTEDLFTKWRKLLTTLLLMYPVIGAIFGASQLASQIVMAGSDDMLVQIAGAGISVIPLFITPIVMKTAGGVLNRFGGIVNNKDKGVFDRMRKGAAGVREAELNRKREARADRAKGITMNNGAVLGKQGSRRRRTAAAIASVGVSSRIARDKKRGFDKAVADEAEASLHAKRALEEDGYAERVARDPEKATSLKASALTTLSKMEDESVDSQIKLIKGSTDPTKLIAEAMSQFIEATEEGDTNRARAAQSILLNSGSPGLEKLSQGIKYLEGESDIPADMKKGVEPREKTEVNVFNDKKELQAELRRDLNSAGLKGRDNALASWSYMDSKLGSIQQAGGTYSGLSDRELAGQSVDNIKAAVLAGAVSANQAQRMLDSDNLGPDFNEAKRAAISQVSGVNYVSNEPQNQAPSGSNTPTQPIVVTPNPQQATPSIPSTPQVNVNAPQNPIPTPSVVQSQPGELKINHDTPVNQTQTVNQANSSNYTSYANNSATVTNSNYAPAAARETEIRETIERVSEPSGSSQFKQTSGGLFVPPSYTPKPAPTVQPVQVVQQVQQPQQSQPSPSAPTTPKFQPTPPQRPPAPRIPNDNPSSIDALNNQPRFPGDTQF